MGALCARDRMPVGGGIFAWSCSPWLLRATTERCARVRSLGCWRTTRGTSTTQQLNTRPPMRLGAFCALYGHVGYCRLADGSEPVYQRPWLLPSV